MGEGLKREEENKLRYFDVIARFGLHRGDLDPRLLRIPLKLEGHGKSTAIGKTVEEVCASALEWLQERDPEQWGKNPKADFMKKEASEQTTVSGKDQYCPCYTYVDGDIDPDCPMHGQKQAETQKPLSLLLDEIEERAKNAQEKDFYSAAKFRYAVSESADDVPALVKVVQHLRECIKAECSGVVAQACDMEAAAILNQK